LPPDRGTITLDGQGLNRLPPEKRDIALVLQRGLLFPHLTVGENVAFGLKMRGVNRAEREKQAIAMLHQVQLEGFADRKPSELSGGQAQRVALARSLVVYPKLLLLDEPLSALDANLREEMQNLILQLQTQTGVTMLIVTHDQAEAVVMSQRIALMFNGCLRQVDTPERIYQQPCDASVAQFMGGVNFFSMQAQGQQWTLPNGFTLLSDQSQQGSLQVTIRPEQIRVFTQERSPAHSFHNNWLPATVLANRFTGTQRKLTLAIAPELTLQAWVAPTQDFCVGQSVWAHLPPAALWCFPQTRSFPQAVEVS
jgi:ABC-type Fe3+/spermidine/putrescine transport system ATPase subunit